ncbi:MULTISPECIES: YlbF family regulator [Enterococcaceae]|uniref:YlbF family regulator n=1 Tax=Enterococcaceae TaxID=81852 RepID=UPI000E4E55DA|nr:MULTISPECIES: YlbF family regulator [Enterococcaceae]RGI29742.1 YlbF family regulator [Melissococcus sp. OM08-11BH]UNM89644.1 YlbF family regulator [Vagococcus sp. CY52-2]
MSSNIYDSANQIEREIRQMDEFLALSDAFDAVKENEEAFELFKAFQELQMTLQQKQMQGEEFSDEDAKQAQEMAEKVQGEALIQDLMQKEQAFSMIVNDLNRIIMQPVQDLYTLD